MINTNIYAKGLKRYRNSFIGWSASIIALNFMGMAFYPLLMQEDMLKQITAFMENPFMQNIMRAFGGSIEIWTNILGFYSTRNATFIMLLGSFFSILLAGKILAREEQEKTAEFLLTRPVTRLEVTLSKTSVFLTYLLLLNFVILVFGFLSLEIFKGDSTYSLKAFIIHWFYALLLMLTFGTIGLFLSLLIKRGRPITNLSIGIIVGAYFIDILSRVTPSADRFGYISPFKFVDGGILNPGYSLVDWRVAYFLGVSLVFLALSFLRYKKKGYPCLGSAFDLDLEFYPLTSNRWTDLEKLFGKRGACGGCWCMWWRLRHSEYEQQKGEGNRKAMKQIVDKGEIPGILAYLEEKPIAWCSVAPRDRFSTLNRSRILKPIDDRPVWSVVCLFVQGSLRNRGLSIRLLKCAIEFVKQQGGEIIEGYPVEPKKDRTPDVFASTGLASAFRQSGFKECARRSDTRPIMRYYITSGR